ncbi:MAG: leucine--tRNA ligase, partial [Clostridia bacterium]|nr:leucine--tRNA ligase [Clostridia bacterium]
FCTSCKCVLANDEVVNGVCERCGSEVVHKVKSQWMLKITAYAQRLIDDLDGLDFLERIKTQEINWIGRSEGAEVTFKTTAGDDVIVYTTRPDTLFGATYMVMAPEHALIDKWKDSITNHADVEAYKIAASKKSDFERTELVKDKTGVMLEGIHAINPVNGKEIPIFISDYVLATYGTGAIMAVPAHDDRDWDFAKVFNLPIIEVVAGGNVQEAPFTDVETGKLCNSEFLNGLEVADAKKAIIEWLEANGKGHKQVNYKLRDWVFSRQRYWGEPVPMVWCDDCGWVPVPEEQLPVELPNVEHYEPTDTGESPLSNITDWVNTTCPHCGKEAKRETDTMPQWAGSSWYFLRYCDPHNKEALASREALDYWMPVDWYNGGMEHVTLHLLYSRFWAKFLYDIDIISCKEPYKKRTAHGMILGENGEKMSKSRGNVINPDDVIAEFGADTLRLYEMFIGDFEKAAPWNPASIRGCKRFLDRVASLAEIASGRGFTKELETSFHKLIKKVTLDIDDMKFNTAIAAMMATLNDVYELGHLTIDELEIFITLLNPFAPHLTEEMWENLGHNSFLSIEKWPEYDESKTVDSTVTIAVQVNGKLRGTIQISKDIDKDSAIALAKQEPKVAEVIADKTIVKEIYVAGKIVNIVVK